MDFILDHKWIFLITAEIVFWVCAVAFLILRYWFKFDKLSKFVIVIFIVNDLWIALLGFMDFQRTGEFSFYQIIIVIFIVYAMTLGKSDFKKLDYFIKRQVAKRRGEPLNDAQKPVQYYGMALAVIEWKQFAGHIFIFILMHVIFFFAFGFSESMQQTPITELFSVWFNNENNAVPFNHEGVNQFSQVWLLILLIDFAITLSYTIFPKRKPAV